MNFFRTATTAALALFVASSAQSATLTATHSTGYTSGASTATFDINSSWNGTDEIVGAYISGQFVDDGDRIYTGSTRTQTGTRTVISGYSKYRCGFFRICSRPNYETIPVYSYVYNYYDSFETVGLSIGSQSAFGQTAYYEGRTRNTVTRGYTGTGSFSLYLNADNLADLADDGILVGSLFVKGDVKWTSTSLTVKTQPAPPVPAVPLPASGLLLLAGLGGIGALRSRSTR